MQYAFKGKSVDEFSNLPKDIQLQIMKKLKFFMSSLDPLYFAEHLNNFDLGEYRFRIGDYRVSFDVENDTAKILKVSHRKDIYR
ncbi:MAG: type II toxin-antitoxin system RelE/ParE family toxin [Candidatus Parcubacteria bacterium]|nr:type II toxin-antitoxin system RelE/ParE family toxin [Candidatus Parcubacteria bacterium]